MADITMHVNESDSYAMSFTDELARLTTANDGVAVTLTGSPTVTIRDSSGTDVTDDWASPAAQLADSDSRVDFKLDPPASSEGSYTVTVECDHTNSGHVVGLREDGLSGVLRKLTVTIIGP